MTINNDENLFGRFAESYEPINELSDTIFNLKAFSFMSVIENIQPDAKFLFSNVTRINIIIATPTASNDPFTLLSCMPKLESVDVGIGECSITKFPDLLKLKKLSLTFHDVEVAADAFDHLTGLESFSITSYGKEAFEIGLAPIYLKCDGDVKVLKLNSTEVSTIEEIDISGCEERTKIESLLPLVGLKTLTTNTECSFEKFFHTEELHLNAKSISCLNQLRLKCFLNLKDLTLYLTGFIKNIFYLNGCIHFLR
jgi:hypothetical protein